MQWEVSNRALEVLQNTKDAQGRSIEVCKIRLPPPLFRTYKEAEGLAVRRAPERQHLTLSTLQVWRRPAFELVAQRVDPCCTAFLLASCLKQRKVIAIEGCMWLLYLNPNGRTVMSVLQADHIEKGYVPRIAGERLPATYINHYTANGGAVVPQFGFNAAGTDERALEDIYQAYNGERKVRRRQSSEAQGFVREVLLSLHTMHGLLAQWHGLLAQWPE